MAQIDFDPNGVASEFSNTPLRPWKSNPATNGQMSPNLMTALDLASDHIFVFPCDATPKQNGSPSKKPILVRAWKDEATNNINQIKTWWKTRPDALPAIHLGPLGLFVIDLDNHPGQPDGLAAFDVLLKQHGNLPSGVPIVQTVSGGRHLYFKQPNGEKIGNSEGELPKGINVRGDGGYVIAPGAVTKDGKSWKFVTDNPITAALEAPAWLLSIIQSPPLGQQRKSQSPSSNNIRGRAFAAAALAGCSHELATANSGERNNKLNAVAYHLGRMIARGWLDRTAAENTLLGAAHMCGLAKDDGQRSALATIKSGLDAGEGNAHEDLEDRSPTIKAQQQTEWSQPKPLPDGLLPVREFKSAEFLPASVAGWVDDIAERMQCPPDFVGITAMVALGSVIGRRIGIRPQRRTDWLEVPNLWGCIVGRPGAMKSPAIAEALKPLKRLETQAARSNEEVRKTYELEVETYKLKYEDARVKAKKLIKVGTNPAEALSIDEPEEPKDRRYIANDCTYESLGEIMAANPNGVLVHRDELVSLLKTLDREENAPSRGFYLSAWNGTDGYTFDRIMRGKVHIEAACLSLLGSTQPGRLAEYVRRAVSGGAGDDGLIQRFNLLVWPDGSPEWKNVDRYPDSASRQEAWATFDRLDRLTTDIIGAECDEFEPIPFVRFTDEAQELFDDWRAKLEHRLRSTELSPALESHLAKYRKLVPSLALICTLADGGVGAVNDSELRRALAFAEYLEIHARRCYAAGTEAEASTAKAIVAKIRSKACAHEFKARDIYRAGWSNLGDKQQVQAGLDLLVDLDWLSQKTLDTGNTGGRPTTLYTVNPRAIAW